MNKTQKRIIAIGFFIGALFVLCPPWNYTFNGHIVAPAGSHVISRPPEPINSNPRNGVAVDVYGLLISVTCTALFTCGLVIGFDG
jgi:hypothetical protein